MLNQGVGRHDELSHLRRLPSQQQLPAGAKQGHLLRLELDCHAVQWERHSEFTRYTVIQPLPDAGAMQPLDLAAPARARDLPPDGALRGLPPAKALTPLLDRLIALAARGERTRVDFEAEGQNQQLQPGLTAGALIPVVLWGVWRTTRRIHEKLHAGH